MDTLAYNGTLYYLPENNADVSTLITQARQQGVKIRVRGSGHSFPPQIILEPSPNPNSGPQPINVLLSNMRDVTFNVPQPASPAPPIPTGAALITVQGGCNLGIDPFDITEKSTLANSLFYQMSENGLSVPDMGGITHQTIAGFISMGCSGGSTTYSFDECLYSITVIPANVDNPQPVTYYMGTDNFNAVAVSMGLLGIIVQVQVLGLPAFNIQGSEMINTVGASTQVNLFNSITGPSAPPSLQNWLQTQEYTRIIWWPQPLYGATTETFNTQLNNTRSVVWQASRIAPAPGFKPVPYVEVQPMLGGEFIPEVLAGGIYSLIGKWPSWLQELAGIIGNPVFTAIADGMTKLVTPDFFYKTIFPVVLNQFVVLGQIPGNSNYNPQNFQDYWWHGLPMDNQMNDKLFPVWFTELWIDINQTDAVMATLAQIYNDYYNNGKYNENNMNPPIPNGAFSVEIYAAKSSDFWLSPAYGKNVVRIDVMWIANNSSNPSIYYEMFWDQLKQYDFRAHWAKYNPDYSSAEWSGYLQSVYPKLNDFLALRTANDPNNVFVNDYWAQQLGI